MFEAKAVYRIGKTLSRDSLIAEKQDRPFHRIQNFFFTDKQFIQRTAVGDLLSPSPADVNFIAVRIFLRNAKGTFPFATPAAVACFVVHLQHTFFHFRRLDRASCLHLAFFASAAFGKIKQRHSLPDNAQVIQIRLHTVVRAAPHSDLKFMRQSDIVVSFIETLMKFLT